MRLKVDTNAGAYAVTVSCIRCGTRRLLRDVAADLDGPSFRAYFCADGDAFNAHVPDCRPVSQADADDVYARAGGSAS
jgi:hypothetical protein